MVEAYYDETARINESEAAFRLCCRYFAAFSVRIYTLRGSSRNISAASITVLGPLKVARMKTITGCRPNLKKCSVKVVEPTRLMVLF